MNRYIGFMVAAVVISSFSQILLKKSAGQKHASFLKEYLNLWVIAGYGMMVLSTLATILAYRGMDYKNGPIIESLGYILVMVLSFLILKERIGKRKLIGYGLILMGVIIFYS